MEHVFPLLAGLCELRNLHELDLSYNMFYEDLPQCFNNMLSLKLLDISSNQFTGMILPSLISNLTSIEYIDFSHNKFEGTFLFSSFSNHTKLEAVICICDNENFEVETEEPNGWFPMFQLKVLAISNCNMNRAKESMVPGFLLYQHKLEELDLSHNSLKGRLPSWIIENNTMLERLMLRNNSFYGNISPPKYRNAYTISLDAAGNHLSGTIPTDIHKWLPNVGYLNLSSNVLSGGIPSSISDLRNWVLDLSNNELSGEVPEGFFTSFSKPIGLLKLSNNRLHGEILSGNISLGAISYLYLDNNNFTGKIGNSSDGHQYPFSVLDISNNFFSGTIPSWMSNMRFVDFVVRNNRFEGQFPCGSGSYDFLDVSQNYLSGSIPSCQNLQNVRHLHLGSNRFTGLIPNSFRNLTNVLTLDIGHNSLSGNIPKFFGELSNLKILLLRKNNFSGSIPKQLCQLRNVSFIDLSSNSFYGRVPYCLQNIIGPINLAFTQDLIVSIDTGENYEYRSILSKGHTSFDYNMFDAQDEVQYTTKALSLSYRGSILDYMSGIDLSCNKLTGKIPKELGLLTQILTLNLSHNQLTGSIPNTFSNLVKIESLDLSSNRLIGKIPSEMVKLNSLAVFNVSYNNLSGRLPDFKAQFGTFTEKSYEGNSLLCGRPLEKKCTTMSQVTQPSNEEESTEKWYDIDMTCFYGSFSSTLAVYILGFFVLLYMKPEWHRRWMNLVEECVCTCYYFLYDSIRKLGMIF